MNSAKSILDSFLFRISVVAIVSLYVSELGSIRSIFQRLVTIEFYYEYGVTLLIGFTVMELVYRVDHRLKKKYPLHEAPTIRIFAQLLGGLLIPSALVFLMATLYFYLNGINIFRTDYLVFAFPLVFVLLISLNFIFMVVPYFIESFRNKRKGQPAAIAGIEPAHKNEIFMDMGKVPIRAFEGETIRFLNEEMIKAAYIIEGTVVLKTTELKELITDYTLDELEKSLPSDGFFRLNRQVIVDRDLCNGYKPLQYGKLQVELEMHLPVETVVSQLKAKAFKEWIAN